MPQCGTLCLGKCGSLVEAISQCRTVSRPCGRTVWRGCRPTCVTTCVTCVTTCGCRPACVTAMLAAFQADVTWDFSPQSVPPRKTETRSDSLPLTGRFLMLQNRFIQLAEQMRQRFQKKNWWALYCWGRFTAYNLSKCLNDISFLCLFQHPVMCSSWQKQCLILLNCTNNNSDLNWDQLLCSTRISYLLASLDAKIVKICLHTVTTVCFKLYPTTYSW